MAQHLKISWIQSKPGNPDYHIYLSDTDGIPNAPKARIPGTGLGHTLEYTFYNLSEGGYYIKVFDDHKTDGPTILNDFKTILGGDPGPFDDSYRVPEPCLELLEFSLDGNDKTRINRIIDSEGNSFLTFTVQYDRGVVARTAYVYSGDIPNFEARYPNNDMLPIPAFGIIDSSDIEIPVHETKPITASVVSNDGFLYLDGGQALYYRPADLGSRSSADSLLMFNALDETGTPVNTSFN